MASDRFYIKQWDLKPDLRVRLLDEDVAVDLTGATQALFLMSSRRRGAKVSAPMSILDQTQDATKGVVSYTWQAGDTDTAGEWNAEIQVLWPSSKPQTFPANSYITVTITKDLGGQ